jgi:hypothetical protein
MIETIIPISTNTFFISCIFYTNHILVELILWYHQLKVIIFKSYFNLWI